MTLHVRRLGPGDEALAATVFAVMAEGFEEQWFPLSEDYLRRLLEREETWVLAALEHDEVLGGLTAHVIPMTRAEELELFVYDIAVAPHHQRRGVGRALIEYLRNQGLVAANTAAFVLADNEDDHALEFYRALGGTPGSVTIFSFDPPDKPDHSDTDTSG